MKYENQNDYPTVSYPSPLSPDATIKSSGCGCVSSVNVLRFFGFDVSVEEMAKTFIDRKIRIDGGTDMEKASQYLCDTYGLKCSKTSDEKVLAEVLKSGSCIIANVGGDRDGHKGIFSTDGHYINVIGNDNTPPKPLIVFDCGNYAGKYSSQYRQPYVSLFRDDSGNTCLYTSAEALDLDTANRTPNYYVFYKADTPSDWAKDAWAWGIQNGITDGKDPQGACTREMVVTMLSQYQNKK